MFESINHELRYDFVYNIAQANRLEMGNLIKEGNFGDKGDIGVV